MSLATEMQTNRACNCWSWSLPSSEISINTESYTAVPQTPICSRFWKFQNRHKIPVHPDHPSSSQFILEANRQPKPIGEKISACRNFSPYFGVRTNVIRNRRSSVFIGVCPSLSLSILVYRWSQIGVYRWRKLWDFTSVAKWRKVMVSTKNSLLNVAPGSYSFLRSSTYSL